MNNLSHRRIIVKYLKSIREQNWDEGWVEGFRLRGTNTPFGWIGTQGDKRARELALEGKIERKYRNRYAVYRYLPIVEKELTSEEILIEARK